MKRLFFVFVLAIMVFRGTAGAQENEIRVDIGPLMVPLFLGNFLEKIYADTSGAGFRAGYSRMLSDYISIGADFSFITARVEAESFEAEINSIDAGVYARYYPWKKVFYLQTGLGIVSSSFGFSTSTAALEDFKRQIDPYTGVSGVFDLGFGWRWIIGRHFIIDASVLSGLYMGKALSTTTLFKLASGGIPALSGGTFPLRFDAAIAFGLAF